MFEEYQICPYTGLRSFTEDESLYFKGREEHIEHATEQLQRNKFLMLTGASGDGKSSLVYAGIIPNARAGFLRSKYSQWCVADFRPERSPFKNLCKAVAKQLEIANPKSVESELQHGFSALVDLYRNSKRFVETESDAWQHTDQAAKTRLNREAANLIILVDQFEEFFTNPENYHRGVPSGDANLVLNLLLETSRIALEEDLPIYIVFTMRSDYIGQCAAFRGLPEYIGFSQFFVPRLNHAQLQQVIEEPATLSGNRITRRLTERLILDLTEGVDQLPILQHALNQIWLAANNGSEEMDLIHYAMVGGMPVNELPDEQVPRFKQWFESLSPEIKACYHEPNLQNVLDTHTNKLYEQAAIYYQNKTGNTITDHDAKLIIKTAFSCLTKIDQSRAVRNRMTLLEITSILNHPRLDSKAVGDVLNIFREPGNTFIRPFITDDPESQRLQPDQVLDITHESLIRNWEYLEQWAKAEFDNYTVSLDFGQQLSRWVKSGKSNSFLFSIGQLTYFENWYEKVKPNSYWIARYLSEDIAQEKKLVKAKHLQSNSQELLKRSARKHVVTRTIVRYGPKKIGYVLAIIALFMMSSFVLRSYFEQQNSHVLNEIKKETLALADNKKVRFNEKIALLCEELRLGQITLGEIVNSIEDPIERINVIGGLPMMLVFQGRNEPRQVILESLLLTDSLLNAYPDTELDQSKLSRLLKEVNDFGVTLDVALFYNHDATLENIRKRNARRAAQWVLLIINQPPAGYNDIRNFTVALESALNRTAFTPDELQTLIQALSPLERNTLSDWHQSNFQKDKLLVRGTFNYGFKFNGLYQELAYLYAATGNSDKALQCIDSLLSYNSNYFSSDYNHMIDNASTVASYFFTNGQAKDLDAFVKGYCSRKKITEVEFYNRLIGRFFHLYTTSQNLHLHPFMNTTSNLNLHFTNLDQIVFFCSKEREASTATTKDEDLRNFQLALSYKNEGILKSVFSVGFSDTVDTKLIWPLFDKALKHYKLVQDKFLEQVQTMVDIGTNEMQRPNKFLFLYPDFRTAFTPTEPRAGYAFYASDSFLKYLLERGYINSFYQDEKTLEFLERWLFDYEECIETPQLYLAKQASYAVLVQLENELSKKRIGAGLDFNLFYFYLGRKSYELGDSAKSLYYYRQVNHNNAIASLKENDRIMRLIAYMVIDLTKLNQFEEAHTLIRTFKNSINRSNLYAFAAGEIARVKGDEKVILQLIDSALVEMTRVKDLTTGQPNREQLAFALTMQDPQTNQAEALRIIKNINGKSFAMMRMCQSSAFHSKLYSGMQGIPDNISDMDRSLFLWNILFGYQYGMKKNPDNWEEFTNGHRWWIIQWIFYVDDNE